jgi:hypothetical protein
LAAGVDVGEAVGADVDVGVGSGVGTGVTTGAAGSADGATVWKTYRIAGCGLGRNSSHPAAAAIRISTISETSGPTPELERREALLGTGASYSAIQDMALAGM